MSSLFFLVDYWYSGKCEPYIFLFSTEWAFSVCGPSFSNSLFCCIQPPMYIFCQSHILFTWCFLVFTMVGPPLYLRNIYSVQSYYSISYSQNCVPFTLSFDILCSELFSILPSILQPIFATGNM